MKKDNYYLDRIFSQYYEFILSGGTTLYLYLAMHSQENAHTITYSMSELEVNLGMSHASIRKYEMILVMIGLLDIEIDYYHMYTADGYQIKQKKYTLYEPLTPDEFNYAIGIHAIPSFEKVNKLLPSADTFKYQDFKDIYENLISIANEKIRLLKHKEIEVFSLVKRPFKPYQPVEDVYSIKRLFDVYDFLPQKVIIFYLYLWRYWIQSDSVALGMHIPRKQIKSELGYGDEQIREAMYQLCAVQLLDLQKDKYYRYYLIAPLARASALQLRPPSAMYFLLPKDNFQKKKYIYLYESLEYILKRKTKTM